ncbi:uncharacterized protein PITG_22355 [Phytophthora infestans T30-4]|uniref:Jacalin-type lectin domain-containing protein n=1 Tax=Phytophthora infestans (strain T30-4) TaxID=403677 RepID=D0RM68_PHYIT|nr:uncharacterized protein PITG_22355 [Phytophthora infestans T30-4]EEY59749.1 conserved hypothetical protein [Phytophthora infestans T30-4]|eukprot:XP_002909862.1 conserved hypothetical protein [Phytophthora infestans T30-4]
MEIHVAKKLGSKHLRLFTNRGNSVGAGSKTDESATVDAPEGYQFSGFFGRAGTEVYELGAIWTRINATHLYLTDDMGSEWYGKKMRNWVGPTIDESTVVEIQDFLDSNTTCGFQLKTLTDRVSTTIQSIRNATPSATSEDIRVTMIRSSLVLTDVAFVTNNCMGEILRNKTTESAFQTRDLLRKTMGVIIDQLIETNTTNMGVSVAKDDATLESANLGLVPFETVPAITTPDTRHGRPQGFADRVLATRKKAARVAKHTLFHHRQRMLPIHLETVLFLKMNRRFWDANTVAAIVNAKKLWSLDKGGRWDGEHHSKFAEVKVASRETVTWNATIAELQDKTLYLDRWRPDFIGIPGSDGGSLMLWVPRSSKGGHLALNVQINAS